MSVSPSTSHRDQAGFDPSPAAARLAQAYRDHSLLTALAPEIRPVGLDQAYAVQSALREALGEDVAGYKVAAANVAALRLSEFGLPLFGYMARSRMHGSDVALPVPVGAPYMLEVEVALEIAGDVQPATTALNVQTMIAGAHLAIEVVRSRYVDRTVVGASSFVADDSAFHAFVQGDRLSQGVDPAVWTGSEAQLLFNGESITTPLSGETCTEPLTSLELFWTHAARHGLTLKRGQLITTGTLVKPVDVSAPGRYEGRLGHARVGFSIV